MELERFRERATKVKENKKRRLDENKRKRIREDQLEFVFSAIEVADQRLHDEVKIMKIELTDTEKKFLQTCGIKYEPVLGLPTPLPRPGSNRVKLVPKGVKLSW
jgi:hypothetical protein